MSEIVRSVRNIDGPFRQIYTTTLIFHTLLDSRHAVVNNETSEFGSDPKIMIFLLNSHSATM